MQEIRSGLRGAGPNNGLVLLFETGEDLALMQQLLSRHSHDIFLDVVKGVACLDHYLRLSRPGRPAAYSWPAYQYRVGEGGRWTASVSAAGCAAKRIEAETKPECIYNICESLLGAPPGFNNFVKWYTYPVFHSETSRMTASLEHILELLPLQNHIERQLFTNRVQVVLEVLYPRVGILIFISSFIDLFCGQQTSSRSKSWWRSKRRPCCHTCDCIKTVVFNWKKIVDLVRLLMHSLTFSDNKNRERKISLFRVEFFRHERKVCKNETRDGR